MKQWIDQWVASLSNIRVYGGPQGLAKGVLVSNGLAQGISTTLVRQAENASPEIWRKANIILRLLLDSGISGISAGANCRGVTDLFNFSMKSAKDTSLLSRTVISIGFGGSEAEAGLRLPSYIIPGLEILRSFGAIGLPMPKLRVFSAQSTSIRVNNLDQAVVWKQTARSFAIMQAFVDQFYPDVKEHILFDLDRWIDQTPVELLRDALKEAASENSDLLEMFQTMVGQMARHQKSETSDEALDVARGNLYPAYHALLFGDVPNSLSPFLESLPDETQLISIGGPPERYFNVARIFAADAQKDSSPSRISLRFIVPIGKQPVYYPDRNDLGFKSEDLQKLRSGGDLEQRWRGLCEGEPARSADYQVIREKVGVEGFVSWSQEIVELFEGQGLGASGHQIVTEFQAKAA